MYRIELAPGEETVFRTIEELAVAVRNGLVTTRCRIYHNASQKWLPIEFHPHYKKALSLPAARVAEAAAPRTSGHPPRLETLSFAVAARPTPEPVAAPTPEPVAAPTPEPATETRGGNHPAQAGPQAERSAEELSVKQQPVEDQRAAHQRVAEHGGAQHSDEQHSDTAQTAKDRARTARAGAEQSATAHSTKQLPARAHSTKQHSDAEHSGAEHSGTEHSGTVHLVPENPVAKHRVAEHRAAEHPVTKHPVTKHAVTKHAVTKHAVMKHVATDHPAAEQGSTIHSAVLDPAAADETSPHASMEPPAIEHPAAEHSPTDDPMTERPDAAHPWAEGPEAEQLQITHDDYASHAAMAAEPPIQAAPAPQPKSKSLYRPDTYLPRSVRITADDPFVAIAPEPAIAPPVAAEPVKPWPVMPAVPEVPELPTISYPEFTPAEEPVAGRASSSRGHRALQVAVAVLVLAAGGYLAVSFYSPVRGSHGRGDASTPAAAVADRPSLPEDTPPRASSAVMTKPSPDRPAVVTPTAPASSGFAAALEPRAIASGPAPMLPAHAGAPQLPPAGSTTDSTALAAPIAPAPAQMRIDVPALPGGDSLVAQPSTKGDSGMKRILRAVTGGKDPR